MATTTLTYLIQMRAREARRETAALGRGAKSTAGDLDHAADKTRELGEQSKHASRDLKRLSRDLRTVGTGLSGMSAGAGRSTRALGGLLGGLSASAAAGGPATLALAGLTGGLIAAGVAAVAVTKSMADATAHAREYSEQIKSIPALAEVIGPIPEASIRSLEATTAAVEAMKITMQGASLSLVSELAPAMQGATTLTVALTLALTDLITFAAEKLRNMPAALSAPLNLLTGGISGALQTLTALNDTLTDGEPSQIGYINRANELIGAMAKTTGKTEGATAAVKTHTRALREQKEELSELARATQEFEAAHGGRDDSLSGGNPRADAEAFLSSLGVSINALSATDQAQLDQIRLLNDLTRGLITADQYEAGVSAINQTLEQTGGPGPSARSRLSGDQLGEALSLAGGVAGGDLLSLLSLAGPAGAGVGALLGGVASLGGAGGATAIAEELDEFREDLLLGLRELPSLFAEVIPAFADALATELPAALIETLPDLFKAIADLINPVSTVRRIGQTVEGLDIPVISEIGGFVSDSIDFVRGLRDQLFGGSRDQGGRIGQPGYYFLHPGEEVVRNNRQSSQRARAGSGSGSSVSVSLRSPSLFSFLYELERVTGAGGLREDY